MGDSSRDIFHYSPKNNTMRLKMCAALMIVVCWGTSFVRWNLWAQVPSDGADMSDKKRSGKLIVESFLDSKPSRKWQRTIKIAPRAVSTGIRNGSAIVYGHYLKPPFLIEVEGMRVFLNGVQVSPSLVAQRESGTRQISEESRQRARQQISIQDKIRAKYRRDFVFKNRAQLKLDLAEYAKSFELVERAYWEGENFLIKYSSASTMMLSLTYWRSPAERNGGGPSNKAMLQVAEIMRNILSRGDCLLLSSEGMMKAMADPREQVNRVVQSENADEQKRAALKEIFDSEDAAMDVIQNFDVKEWAPRSP